MKDLARVNVSALIGSSESTTIEWKPSLSQIHEIIESITAFANTEGGRLFVGVSKVGDIFGIQIGQGTIEGLVNRIAQHTDPIIHPNILVKQILGKQIIIIEVKQSKDQLVLASGRPYKRVGPSTRQMSKDEYENLILEKHKDKLGFDTMVCRAATLKDIDPAKVQWFLQKSRDEGRLTIPSRISTKDALVYLKVLHKEKLNNAGIMLFGNDPQKFFVQSKIRAGRIKGTEGHDFLDMKVLEGSLPELRDGAMSFVAQHIRKAVFFDANQRHDKWEYPLRAIEEAINNALAHRDYLLKGDIQLTIYDDRIEIWNPGELTKYLTLEQLKGKHKSIPRNQFLADRLYLIKYIERWGRGTSRIVEEMRQDKLPDPVFSSNSGGFEVILIGPGKAFDKVIDDIKLHKIDLNDRQKKALGFIEQHGEISRKQYVDITGVSQRQVNKDLRDLLGKKIIVQIGAGRSTKYKVHD